MKYFIGYTSSNHLCYSGNIIQRLDRRHYIKAIGREDAEKFFQTILDTFDLEYNKLIKSSLSELAGEFPSYGHWTPEYRKEYWEETVKEYPEELRQELLDYWLK